MSVEEFFVAVKQMRFAQIKYFRTKTKEDLLDTKSLEKMVDTFLAERRFLASDRGI